MHVHVIKNTCCIVRRVCITVQTQQRLEKKRRKKLTLAINPSGPHPLSAFASHKQFHSPQLNVSILCTKCDSALYSSGVSLGRGTYVRPALLPVFASETEGKVNVGATPCRTRLGEVEESGSSRVGRTFLTCVRLGVRAEICGRCYERAHHHGVN